MYKLKKRDRQANDMNAGSMADIAFLLLIFFLVTTTIQVDKGILVKLPPWNPDQPITDIASRNVCHLWVNSKNEFLLRGESILLKDIKPKIKLFITNPHETKDMAVRPNKAVVSLKNDRGTDYLTYINVYNEIKAAYNELWNEEAQKHFAKDFEGCSLQQRKEIKNKIPMVISEAEPTDYVEL